MLGRRQPAILLLPFGAAALASFAVIGADARWFVAVGRVAAHGHLPRSLPFATAPTSGWHDAPVLGQIIFHLFDRLAGDRGLVVLQILAAAAAFAALARMLREFDAGPVVGILVALGAVPTLLVTRSALFALAFFPLLLLLLHEGRRLWLAVPLIALWANLYGGVLVGWALLAVYVVVARRRAWPVLALSTVALGATPALWHTFSYYRGVFENEAAQRGIGLWSPLDASLFGILTVAVVAVLVLLAGRHWQLWEAVAAAGLAVGTVHTLRVGVWLIFVAALPAARGCRIRAPRPIPLAFFVVTAAAVVVGLATSSRANARVLAQLVASTKQPVLADAIAGEQVEALGGRVYVANPLDAFRRTDQKLYVDWLLGDPAGRAAVDRVAYVLVQEGSDAAEVAARDARLMPRAHRDGYVLFARR